MSFLYTLVTHLLPIALLIFCFYNLSLLIYLAIKKLFTPTADDHSKHVTESKIFSRLTDLIRALSSDSLQSVSSMFYSAWVSLHCFVVRLFLKQSGLTFLQPLTKHLVDSGDLSILSEPGVFHDMLTRPSFWRLLLENLHRISLLIVDDRQQQVAFLTHCVNPLLQQLIPGGDLVIQHGRLPDVLNHISSWLDVSPARYTLVSEALARMASGATLTHADLRIMLDFSVDIVSYCQCHDIFPTIARIASDTQLGEATYDRRVPGLLQQHAEHLQTDPEGLEDFVLEELERFLKRFPSSCGRLSCLSFTAFLSAYADWSCSVAQSDPKPSIQPSIATPWGMLSHTVFFIFQPLLSPFTHICQSAQSKLVLCSRRESFWRKLISRDDLLTSLCKRVQWLANTWVFRQQIDSNKTGLCASDIEHLLSLFDMMIHILTSSHFSQEERMIIADFLAAVCRGQLGDFLISLERSERVFASLSKLITALGPHITDEQQLSWSVPLLHRMIYQDTDSKIPSTKPSHTWLTPLSNSGGKYELAPVSAELSR